MMQQSLMSNADSPKIRLEVISSPAIRCGVVLHHLKDGYAARANSIGAYFELNRQVRYSFRTVDEYTDRTDDIDRHWPAQQRRRS